MQIAEIHYWFLLIEIRTLFYFAKLTHTQKIIKKEKGTCDFEMIWWV